MSINNIGDLISLIKKYSDKENSNNESEYSLETSTSVINCIRLPRKTYWGINSINALREIEFQRIALITGSSNRSQNMVNDIRRTLSDKIEIKAFNRSNGEPNLEEIKKLSLELNEYCPNQILAIGGGSTIDSAKLLRLLYDNPEYDFDGAYELNEKLRKKVDLIAMPTIFGSGAEVSSAAAFNKDGETSKSILLSNDFLPDKVILDPKLAKGVSEKLIFAGAFDALTHGVEGFASIVKNPMVNFLAVSSIQDILAIMKKMISHGLDDELIEKLCYSSYYCGIVQNHCSVGLVHSFAHQLNSFGVSHGVGNAIFLSHVIELNSKQTKIYEELSSMLGFESLELFTKLINKLLKESCIMPKKEVLVDIYESKTQVINGAINDITYRTNPVNFSEQDVADFFDKTMTKLINE